MPVVRVLLIRGYAEEVRLRLMRRLTAAVRATVAAPLDGIVVAIDEVEPGSYLRGGEARSPGAALDPPGTIALGFLDAMAHRDLTGARESLAADFRMRFPGGREFDTLEAMVAWAATRYRSIAKTIEAVEECAAERGTVVWVRGTLSGTWPDGTGFEGVRFVDRFLVDAGKLHEQDVWNDLAEASGSR